MKRVSEWIFAVLIGGAPIFELRQRLFSTMRGSGWPWLNTRTIPCELSGGHPLPRMVLNSRWRDLIRVH